MQDLSGRLTDKNKSKGATFGEIIAQIQTEDLSYI